MKEEYKLSIVFCAVNETFSLVDTYTKISSCDCAAEYIFVLSKNASKNCCDTVKELCKNENCNYFVQSGYGLGNAIRNSIDVVNGTHMIVWPADDGMDTDSFPKMVELSIDNPEKIISVSRWLEKNGFEGYGKIRKGINFLSQKIFSLIYSSNLTDFTNPTQIVPVSLYRKIKWQGEGFDFVPEMTFKPLKLGYEFIEVPCKSLKRREGATNSGFFELIKYYYVILKIYCMDLSDIIIGEGK
ncbi:MAG: glycosyltransferase [Clostridia bacterium]|nr:glycosyltransferase [Clostridia bacterium]